jgi:hypothetical protein
VIADVSWDYHEGTGSRILSFENPVRFSIDLFFFLPIPLPFHAMSVAELW